MGRRSTPDSPLTVDQWLDGRPPMPDRFSDIAVGFSATFCLFVLVSRVTPCREAPCVWSKTTARRLVALAASRTVMGPSPAPWLQLGSQYGATQATRPQVPRRSEEPTLIRTSKPRQVRKPLSKATRSSILAYAETHRFATHEAIAKEFAVGRRWLSTPFVVWTAKLTVTPSGPSEELWLPRKRPIKRNTQQLHSSNIRDMLRQVPKFRPLHQTQARLRVWPLIEESHIPVDAAGHYQATRRNQHLYHLCPITLPPCQRRASRTHPRHLSVVSFPYMTRRLRSPRSCHNHLRRALLAQSKSSQPI